MRLREILIVRPVPLDEVRDRVQPQPINPHVEPVVHHLDDLRQHLRVVEVEIRLVAEEPVPEELLRLRVPGPVGFLGVGEDDPGLGPLLVVVRPDVEVASGAALLRDPGLLEPRVLVAGVVDHELGDHPQAALVRLGHERLEVGHLAVGRVDRLVVGDVVAVVAQRRGVERQQPDRCHAQRLDVVEPAHQPGKVPDAVAVAVLVRLHVDLVDDRVAIPVPLGTVDHAVGAAGLALDVHAYAPGAVRRQIAYGLM